MVATAKKKAKPHEKALSKPAGRPTLYTQEIADEICLRLAGGQSLNQICRDEHLPCRDTVYAWALDSSQDNPPEHLVGFSDKYTRARLMQADALMDDTIDIADDGSNDWMERETKSGRIIEVIDHEHVQRSKLRVETRFKIAEKQAPRKYGKTVDITTKHESLNDGPSEEALRKAKERIIRESSGS